ncbi:hypothetical protein Acr_14g0003730 [Actinidia rufa]|uniref:Uncharacterized protein n=1 Tax=Actinidia rufa TaxID=165716 RepID=A0A7J0FS28_9ERIC|nr:hypothetical protein Acr_14g0003730 [Actinidia rufa]
MTQLSKFGRVSAPELGRSTTVSEDPKGMSRSEGNLHGEVSSATYMPRKRAELLLELRDKDFTPFPKKMNNMEVVVAGANDDVEETKENTENLDTREGSGSADRDKLSGKVDELSKATLKSLWMKNLYALERELDEQHKIDAQAEANNAKSDPEATETSSSSALETVKVPEVVAKPKVRTGPQKSPARKNPSPVLEDEDDDELLELKDRVSIPELGLDATVDEDPKHIRERRLPLLPEKTAFLDRKRDRNVFPRGRIALPRKMGAYRNKSNTNRHKLNTPKPNRTKLSVVGVKSRQIENQLEFWRLVEVRRSRFGGHRRSRCQTNDLGSDSKVTEGRVQGGTLEKSNLLSLDVVVHRVRLRASELSAAGGGLAPRRPRQRIFRTEPWGRWGASSLSFFTASDPTAGQFPTLFDSSLVDDSTPSNEAALEVGGSDGV